MEGVKHISSFTINMGIPCVVPLHSRMRWPFIELFFIFTRLCILQFVMNENDLKIYYFNIYILLKCRSVASIYRLVVRIWAELVLLYGERSTNPALKSFSENWGGK